MPVVRGDGTASAEPGLFRAAAKVRNAVALGVVEGWVGQAPIALAVEPDAVQLELQRVVAVASRVEQHAGFLVDLHELVRLVGARRGERSDQPAAEIVEKKFSRCAGLR
jgi:hypothetical protein